MPHFHIALEKAMRSQTQTASRFSDQWRVATAWQHGRARAHTIAPAAPKGHAA
jgi:hypothetical protein